MAECVDNLSNSMATLSVSSSDVDVNKHLEELGLVDKERAKLLQIENNYESIFSWEVKELTGTSQNLMLNLIDKVRGECEMIVDEENAFNLNRFYFQLIICYELYINKSYKESLLEIENVVQFLETCTFDESNTQYSDAYHHIARATHAYIAITLNVESEKITKNVKTINSLNRAEMAAICAVKARVFMEYPPKGNEIALKFSEQARHLHSTEPEWIIIWLKAKGRVRRYHDRINPMPEKDEIDAAEILSTSKTNPRHLVQASKIFMEIAFNHKLKKKIKDSNELYKLSSDILLKAIELTKDNIELLNSYLKTYINLPKEFHSKTIINQIIQKLTKVENTRVDHLLGKYYLKYEKDYEKAKMYLSRGMAAGDFNSSLQLLKVECLLKPVNEFPLVQSLNMIYNVFPSPIRRLIVLSQILIYYCYYENNLKELMQYLKLYLDQEIDDAFKKKYLISAYPMFKINGVFKVKKFLDILSIKVNNIIKHHEWRKGENENFKDTLDRFNRMAIVQLNQSQYDEDKKKNYSNSNKRYNNRNLPNDSYIESWQKQQVNSSKNYIDLNKYHRHPSASKSQNKTYEKKSAVFNQKSPTLGNIGTEGSSRFSFKLKTSVNDLSLIDSKKFEKHYSSSENVHVVSINNESTFKPVGRGGCKQNWRSQQNRSKIQGIQSFHNNWRNNDSQNVQREKSVKCQRENSKHKEKIFYQSPSDDSIENK